MDCSWLWWIGMRSSNIELVSHFGIHLVDVIGKQIDNRLQLLSIKKPLEHCCPLTPTCFLHNNSYCFYFDYYTKYLVGCIVLEWSSQQYSSVTRQMNKTEVLRQRMTCIFYGAAKKRNSSLAMTKYPNERCHSLARIPKKYSEAHSHLPRLICAAQESSTDSCRLPL